MTRKERFERGLAITARLYELADKYNWTPEQTAYALIPAEEASPVGLHNLGEFDYFKD